MNNEPHGLTEEDEKALARMSYAIEDSLIQRKRSDVLYGLDEALEEEVKDRAALAHLKSQLGRTVTLNRVTAGGKEVGVATITRDNEVSVVFFRLLTPYPPGQTIPGMEAGKVLPDEQILFEVVLPQSSYCMTFANIFCDAWKMLRDRESGIEVEPK